jgi:hypothetical protein
VSDPLSPAWVAELNGRLAAVPVGETEGPRLRLGLRVVGDDGSTRRFTAVIGGALPGEFTEGEEPADVVLVESTATALRLLGGAVIGEELAAGNVKLEGDVSKLLGADAELRALAEAFSS